MADDQRYKLYLKEHYRYMSLHAKNLINQDLALLQLSGGLLAILPTFGKNLLLSNKTISYIVIIFLSLTIFQVVLGYLLSNHFFSFTVKKLRQNYDENEDLEKDIGQSLAGKINDVFNITSFISFFLAMVFFLALLIIYLGGLK